MSQAQSSTGRPSGGAIELPALTSLRGIAALTVVFFHSSFLAYHFADGGTPEFWRRGYLAVDLFFFLSGFVLTYVYGTRLSGGLQWQAVGKFFWARFCRIYPTSLFVVLVYVLAHTFGRLVFPADAPFSTQLVACLTLMQVPWLHTVALNGPSWSISAEFYAYLTFPFAIPLLLHLHRRGVIASMIVLLITVIIDRMIGGQQTAGWIVLLRTFPEFLAGAFTYRAFSIGTWARIWQKDSTFLIVAVAVGAVLWMGFSDALIVILFPAVLLTAVGNKGHVARMLDIKPLRWLGDISYSVYIFQTIPLMIVAASAPIFVKVGVSGVGFEVLAASAALAGGILVHRCIDVPGRAALRRLPGWIALFASRHELARQVSARTPFDSGPFASPRLLASDSKPRTLTQMWSIAIHKLLAKSP